MLRMWLTQLAAHRYGLPVMSGRGRGTTNRKPRRMTLERKITTDLSAGQATLANLCANVGMSAAGTAATLRRMEREGKIWTMQNKDGDTVYKLTYQYKQKAS